jgi:hypothetical protein
MYKPTPKELAEAHATKRAAKREKELAAAHDVLLQKVSGVSGKVRMAALTTGTGALAGHVSDLLLRSRERLRMVGEPLLHAAKPHASLPAMFEGVQMFQQAEQLCLRVRQLPDAEMWTRGEWGAMTCSPLAKSMCAEAVQLYEGAITHKYLPAYAPLAWMMSHADPEQSLRLCHVCVEACDARIGAPFAREAKTDCTALRAYLQYEHDVLLQSEIEDETPGGMRLELPAPKAPSIETLHAIAKDSIKHGSKYGHALKWLVLTHDDDVKRGEVDAALKAAEKMGLDFERCRFCFQ